ncbi:hypothetical protein QYE76_063487 [Lolium multiflorum]|uniref:Uncharacterized protein n=1 Tax=Lolium multiflorum TaxID=4521 RepID=A0AAD8S534_LOLMU|nr:hypothetical protein QYE76_063487 [Lolium multiflorum]
MSSPPPSSSHPPPPRISTVLSWRRSPQPSAISPLLSRRSASSGDPYGPPPRSAASVAADAAVVAATRRRAAAVPTAAVHHLRVGPYRRRGPSSPAAAAFFRTLRRRLQHHGAAVSPTLSCRSVGSATAAAAAVATNTAAAAAATDAVLPFGGVGATLAPGSTSTPPGMPFHQVCFPPSPSPLPAWIAIRHVSAAVRLQAAARGLLVRRRVREMRYLQLHLLQVALHCATDLDLVRCVGDLGRTVSPTGGGHAIFPAGSDLKVCAIDSHSAGRRHGVTDRSAPRSTTAFRRRPPRLLLSAGFHGIQVAVEVHVRRADGVHFMFRGQQ